MCEENNALETTENIYLPPKRLHPADTIFSFLKIIKESILGLGIGALALIRQSPTYALIFIGIFLLFLLGNSFFSWLRHTYRVEDGELRIEKGVFIRKKSYISINRIHKIDFTANVLHRIFKLVQVNVDTAGGTADGEVTLTALRLKDAEVLRNALKREQASVGSAETDAERTVNYPKKRISWKRLFLAGATSGSAGFLILGGLVLFSQVQQFIPDRAYEQAIDYFIQLSIVFIVVSFILLLVGLWMLGTLGTVIKFGNFIIEKRPKELFIKRGLLETKELTIPFDRIQAIEVEQSILRRPLKCSRVVAVTAGSSENMTEANPVIFPLLRDKDIEHFLDEFLPDYVGMDQELIPLDKKGRKYYLFKHAILFILAFIPIIYFFPTYAWIPGILIVISLLFGWMKFKEAGYRIDGKRVITRNWSMLTRTRTIVYRRRVQVYEKHQHKLQQLEHLATADFSMIGLGSQVRLRHLRDEDANLIADWFSRRKRDTLV